MLFVERGRISAGLESSEQQTFERKVVTEFCKSYLNWFTMLNLVRSCMIEDSFNWDCGEHSYPEATLHALQVLVGVRSFHELRRCKDPGGGSTSRWQESMSIS